MTGTRDSEAFGRHGQEATGLAVTGDGAHLFSVGEGIRLWDLRGRREILAVTAEDVWAVATPAGADSTIAAVTVSHALGVVCWELVVSP